MQLTATDLGHRFDDQPFLFEGLGFTLHAGLTYALVGPSGSGKSTLLNILAGWMEPSTGRIARTDIDRVSWVFQNPHGVPRRTAIDHVALPLLARGLSRPAALRAAEVRLQEVGLDGVASSQFRNLSGGEAQRLMLARGIASAPDLMLIDEPTAQLDAHTSHTVNQAIASMSAAGSIVVVATHDPGTKNACDELIDLAAVS
jgi:ABC-type lipoprotein export system ATPase subunit